MSAFILMDWGKVEILSQDSSFLGWDSNAGPCEYEAGMLITQQHSVVD